MRRLVFLDLNREFDIRKYVRKEEIKHIAIFHCEMKILQFILGSQNRIWMRENTMETSQEKGIMGGFPQIYSAYFELKTLEKQQVQERPSSPLSPETGEKLLSENHPPLAVGKKQSEYQR